MRNTDPDKMQLSSADEHKGIEPINRAVELVREQIQQNALRNRDRYLRDEELPTIYVTTFTYILGGWKAMVSTSWSDGHYYEVTYNKTKGETYIDRYSKDYNEVVPDDKPAIHMTPAPNAINVYNNAPVDSAALHQQLRERLTGNGRYGPIIA